MNRMLMLAFECGGSLEYAFVRCRENAGGTEYHVFPTNPALDEGLGARRVIRQEGGSLLLPPEGVLAAAARALGRLLRIPLSDEKPARGAGSDLGAK